MIMLFEMFHPKSLKNLNKKLAIPLHPVSIRKSVLTHMDCGLTTQKLNFS